MQKALDAVVLLSASFRAIGCDSEGLEAWIEVAAEVFRTNPRLKIAVLKALAESSDPIHLPFVSGH